MNTTLIEPAASAASGLCWPKYPSIYEINTWVWLAELSQKYRMVVDLSSVPAAEWDAIAGYGFDSVWLMGVWERSPAGVTIANQTASLLDDFRRALPDFHLEDNVGSPYCVRRYVVDQHLGGRHGLAIARGELSKRGVRLILDFVPNHVAPDHPWISDRPEYFIRGTAHDLQNDPSAFTDACGCICACGRDPYFPAWRDVLQLNAFNLGLRQAVIDTVSEIAEQCDGIRCDMAMLMLNPIFERTWGTRSGLRPSTEYWIDVISATKRRHPGFLFIAEAYWDLEWELQQHGFDFCYDKKLYDRLEHANAESIRLHLCADMEYQRKLVRFIENHDEPRAAHTFSEARGRAAALAIATLPGIRLFHEGQLEGRSVKLPVFLARRSQEAPNLKLEEFYRTLLLATRQPIFREGEWTLCDRTGWVDNATFQNLVAWTWHDLHERYLVVINLSEFTSQALIQLRSLNLGGANWQLHDVLSATTYERNGDEMISPGLYVELGPWGYHFFHFLHANH